MLFLETNSWINNLYAVSVNVCIENILQIWLFKDQAKLTLFIIIFRSMLMQTRHFSDHNKTLRRSHFLRHHWLNQTSSSCFLCIKVKRNTSTTVITGHFRMVCDHLFILLGDMSSTKIILGCILLVQCRISLTCQWYVKLYWSNAVCLTIHYWISLVLCV